VMRWLALMLMAGATACSRQPTTSRSTPTPRPTASASLHPVPAATSATGSAALPTPELDGVATAQGTWRFQVSADGDQAVFGDPQAPSLFAMRCNDKTRRMIFSRAGQGAGAKTMQIVAADGAATFYIESTTRDRVQASDAISDTFLTQVLAQAKDRIGVRIDSGPTLVMPVASEIRQTILRCAAP
jgi:hypothetical protein